MPSLPALDKKDGIFRKCCTPPDQIIWQDTSVFTEGVLRNEMACPRPSRKAGLEDLLTLRALLTTRKTQGSQYTGSNAGRMRDNRDQRTRSNGVLGLAQACSPLLGLGNSHCWGKLSPLKMRSIALWGPHIRPGGDFCGPRNVRTPDCRLAGQGSAWECWVPWARCGRIILSGATRGKGSRASCGVCLGSVDTEWGRVALGNWACGPSPPPRHSVFSSIP